ncbi:MULTISPECIES: aldehyde dehydrogenase [unclassified Rhodococcus (in: high G+C Gram-positive bacteria)]|uniref:aldehyde dehydrogenase n=1 Tax=unclassified Rhodococcus (in: high G+C Gram-positive bacteria) TaxID=192944 RepID=UPI000B9ADF4F|nr:MULTISPECIES: aldehyde dehydrogenase [unclassified Rhodococcus (in: high G+C Gram-positive bacteria)]OZE37620.1 aldehyde dehydrogenase [Rhodococcus sp. 05-2254-4]OZE40752.1 aldehyde dehydrogenase [Rhodococcus sp. 05-2254-3]OZE45743.1 aldehyde dehydrogenase [Rhodococcus sp. 05-2254-2]
MTSTTTIADYPHLFVGGQWTAPSAGLSIDSVDPATEDVWARVPRATEPDVDRAVDAARAALHGPWSRLTATQRGRLIYILADLLERDAERLGRIETMDNGKPLRDTVGEVKRSVEWLRYYAGAADKVEGTVVPYKHDAHAYTRVEPVGVVAAITPWNSPISLYSWKLGPALAMGNTVVLKPSELTSVSALEFAQLFSEAGFPDGVLNIVPGYGHDAGAHLVAHPGVDKVSFTGSYPTAQAIMRAASNGLKRVSFECGGKSPHIVFPDSDIDRAVSVATHSAFRSTGQSCSLGSRLFLHRDIYADFLDALVRRTERIRVGMPLDPSTHIGPHTSAEQLAKTEHYLDAGRREGGRVVTGGGRPSGFDRGYFVQPTIFDGLDNSSTLASEEVFGPVLTVIPFETEDEVISLANDTSYGLVAGLWTKDISRAHRVAAQLQAGLVSVNTFRPVHWTLPYGGYKSSGLGRENGLAVLREYCEIKSVVIDFSADEPADPFADA